jgi:hypothetical protein
LACGCGQHGGKGAQVKGTKTQETRDPALIALSSASVEVNRRHLAKAMNQSANSRASAKGKPSKASANKAADIPSALVTRLSPKSELMTPYRMDFGWEGKATDALMTLSKALGWDYECDPGTGLGLIRIPESPGGTSLFGLLVEINLRLLPMGEEIEADEILRKLRLRRLRRTN